MYEYVAQGRLENDTQTYVRILGTNLGGNVKTVDV